MKLFSNSIFRSVMFAIILFCTLFFPLFFLLPTLSDNNRIFLALLLTIIVIIEIIVYVFIIIKTYTKPVSEINKVAKKLSLGDYEAKINLKQADSELKNLSLNINNLANEFENLEQMRKSFVANASHELRSPLTSMQGFLQAMLDGTIEDKDRPQYLQIVFNETKRLGALINSMLDLSRLESGAMPLNPQSFDVNELINSVVDRFKPALHNKNIDIKLALEKPTAYVFADKDKITQVLTNLIDNAIKYSSDNSDITVTTQLKGNKVYVSIKDHGEGIGKKEQMFIWDRFYMADKARTPSKSKGTGLGLSIVKRIIDDHKESIRVDSRKGEGATFVFTLTAHKAENLSKQKDGTDNT